MYLMKWFSININCFSFQLQLGRNGYYDVKINVKGQIFPSHKFILAACSEFFRGLFSSKDSSTMVVDLEVMFPTLSVETFDLVHHVIYSGRGEITGDNINDLWHAASQLQVNVLLQECELFQQRRLCKENCVDVFTNAKALECENLCNLSWEVIVREFEFLRQTDKPLHLVTDDVKRLVSSDHLPAASEDLVIDFIVKWSLTEPNKDRKLKHLDKVLSSARICLAKSSCLLNAMRSDEIQSSPKAFKVLQSGLEYSINMGRRHDCCVASSVHREVSPLANVMISLAEKNTHTTLSVRARDGTWYECVTPDENFGKGSVVSYGDFIFAISYDGDKQPFKFNCQTNTWSNLKQLNEKGANYSLVIEGDFLYAVGGNNGDNIERMNLLKEIESTGSEDWEQVTNLVCPVENLSLLPMGNNSVVVFGIKKGSPEETVVQRIDLRTKLCFLFLDDAPGISENSVCLKDRQKNFLLQQDGSLWRIVDLDGSKMDMVYEASLWDDHLTLHGAVISEGDLFVLASVEDMDETTRKWSPKKNFFFSNITIFNRKGSGLVNSVVPKSVLKQKDEFVENQQSC